MRFFTSLGTVCVTEGCAFLSLSSKSAQRSHIPDAAHHAPILPVPTIVTPVNAPSPSHSRADTPAGIPIPHPAPRSLDGGEVAPPIIIHEPQPSPLHSPVSIPPDGWIPEVSSVDGRIRLPPPHELAEPLSPASTVRTAPLPPAPPPPVLVHTPSPAPAPVEPPPPTLYNPPPQPQPRPESRQRNYVFFGALPPPTLAPTPAVRPASPQSMQSKASKASKASTSVSQFDLVGAPRRSKLRIPSLIPSRSRSGTGTGASAGRARGEDVRHFVPMRLLSKS